MWAPSSHASTDHPMPISVFAALIQVTSLPKVTRGPCGANLPTPSLRPQQAPMEDRVDLRAIFQQRHRRRNQNLACFDRTAQAALTPPHPQHIQCLEISQGSTGTRTRSGTFHSRLDQRVHVQAVQYHNHHSRYQRSDQRARNVPALAAEGSVPRGRTQTAPLPTNGTTRGRSLMRP